MEKKDNKSSWLKIIGLIGAAVLIVFGNIGNLVRTIKLAGRRDK